MTRVSSGLAKVWVWTVWLQWGKDLGEIIYLGMNHNFILWTESDGTFGAFEETNKKVVVNVANQIVKTSKYLATQWTTIACNTRSVETMKLDMFVEVGHPVAKVFSTVRTDLISSLCVDPRVSHVWAPKKWLTTKPKPKKLTCWVMSFHMVHKRVLLCWSLFVAYVLAIRFVLQISSSTLCTL